MKSQKQHCFKVGMEFTNKWGKYTIIRYSSARDFAVQFSTTGYIAEKPYHQDLVNNRIVDKWQCEINRVYEKAHKINERMYSATVQGVGYIGGTRFDNHPLRKRAYVVWGSMLNRCYSDKFHSRYPTYKECTVCDRWHSFENFFSDIQSLDNYDKWVSNEEKYNLDKDTIVHGNKIYSPSTCRFITCKENVSFARKKK
ncbi:MAG: hypothetical protein ACRCSY_04025 [Cetobacterium sp.]